MMLMSGGGQGWRGSGAAEMEESVFSQKRLIEFEDGLSNRSHLAVGVLGELWVYCALERDGYAVASIGQRERHRGDLVAVQRATGEKWAVEVKTARRGKDGCYRWSLWKWSPINCVFLVRSRTTTANPAIA